uniref:Putative e3 ubiquitin ligase n=1 Tax=Culex tarsalis TaxID=7177 RepID=A0A1Q3G2W7_CULTA
MVLQGLIGFASSLVIAAMAVAGVYYTVNYIHNRYLYEEQSPNRATSGNNKSWKGYDDWNEISCTICLTTLSGGARPSTRELACGHMFHTKCIEGWLKHTRCCPNCRTDVL